MYTYYGNFVDFFLQQLAKVQARGLGPGRAVHASHPGWQKVHESRLWADFWALTIRKGFGGTSYYKHIGIIGVVCQPSTFNGFLFEGFLHCRGFT